jgi:hypothetical protein
MIGVVPCSGRKYGKALSCESVTRPLSWRTARGRSSKIVK